MSIEVSIVGESSLHFSTSELEATGTDDLWVELYKNGIIPSLATMMLSSVAGDGGLARITHGESGKIIEVSLRKDAREEISQYPGLVISGGDR